MISALKFTAALVVGACLLIAGYPLQGDAVLMLATIAFFQRK